LDGIVFGKNIAIEDDRLAGIEGARNNEESFIGCLRLRD
jgi:hypothetical protein